MALIDENLVGSDASWDCHQFTSKEVEGVNASVRLGWWMFWNVLKRPPTQDETAAASAIETSIVMAFDDWHP